MSAPDAPHRGLRGRPQLVAVPPHESHAMRAAERPAGWLADPGPRLVVRLPNWLGDVLLARPLLASIVPLLPETEIRLIAPAPLLDLIETDLPLAGLDPWPAAGRDRRALTTTLRRWKPSAVLVLPPSFSSAWMAWSSGAAVRIGYRSEGRSWLLSHALERPPRGGMHLAEEYRALATAVGLAARTPATLEVREHAHDRAHARLRLLGIDGDHLVLLGPGAIFGPAKRWSPERFAQVGRAATADGAAVLVCGTAAERAVCDEVAAKIGARAFVLAGETDLLEQAALCARAHLAVCNDSGLAHLAAACGAPTVAVFGSTSSAWTAPLGERVRVVQHAPVCSPCFRRTCRIGYRCLAAVEVADVLHACASLGRPLAGLESGS